MLGPIIKKEFFDNLLNLRFSVGLIVSVLLTVSCVIFQAGKLSERTRDYNTDNRIQNEQIEKLGPISGNFIEIPLKKPEALSTVVTGLSADSYRSFDSNFIPQMFPFIDLAFLVSVIMSLLGLLFSYDSICGERESGTLKLICSNPVSRATVLFGKLIGGTASLLIPFLISILCAAIYIAISPGVRWQPWDWAAFWSLTLASMAFIATFYLLGLMVSAFSNSSSVSILKSIMLWVIIVLVIPNLGPYVSTELYPIPSLVRIKKEYNQLDQDQAEGGKYDLMKKEQIAELDRKYEEQYGELFREYKAIPDNELLLLTGMEAPESELKEMGLAYRRESRDIRSKINTTARENLKKISDDLHAESERQTAIARNIAATSPYADFVYLATDLSGTGMRARKDYNQYEDAYWDLAASYNSKKWDAKRISDPRNFKNNPFDISDRPRFNYQEEPLPERIQVSLPTWE